jgi:hypothetical protein
VIQHRPQHVIPVGRTDASGALVWCCVQVLSEARQASVSSESLTCGVTSNSLPGATPGGGMSDEDMQTYIVQVRWIMRHLQDG